MEDSAAVAGVFLAASALGLAHFTGNTVYDAIGSISIGGESIVLCSCVLRKHKITSALLHVP